MKFFKKKHTLLVNTDCYMLIAKRCFISVAPDKDLFDPIREQLIGSAIASIAEENIPK